MHMTSRLRIITKLCMARKLKPTHTGEVLIEDFLKPLGLSEYFLAKNISVSPRRINEIVRGTRAVTADTALRFGKFFGTSPHFWLALQAQYELAIQQDALGRTLQRHVKTLKTAQ
mgnify:FL=1